MQSKKLEEQVVKLDTQARQAVSQNREDLARMALERKTAIQAELQGLDTQVTQLEQQQEQLIENEKRLRAKIEAFRTKKEVIKAQYSAAEAQVMISEAASGVGEEMADLGLAMQRAEEKTEDMKARADAVGELESAGVFEDITQLGERRQRHRPRAGAALTGLPGGRRAREDEGRARRRDPARTPRRSSRARRRSPSDRPHLGGGAVPAAGRGRGPPERVGQRRPSRPSRQATRTSSTSSSSRCSRWSASDGEAVSDDELVESDVILPPRDVSFEEAAGEFTGDGLIPD